MIGTVIPAIVLAAGKSTRMGRPKANLPLENGDTFLSRIVRTLCAAAVDDVVVVENDVGVGGVLEEDAEFFLGGPGARDVARDDEYAIGAAGVVRDRGEHHVEPAALAAPGVKDALETPDPPLDGDGERRLGGLAGLPTIRCDSDDDFA